MQLMRPWVYGYYCDILMNVFNARRLLVIILVFRKRYIYIYISNVGNDTTFWKKKLYIGSTKWGSQTQITDKQLHHYK